ncbi:MAG: peptide deformylase [Candidatus Azotimanducaceae bacterium]|jgi:peptide deformylase
MSIRGTVLIGELVLRETASPVTDFTSTYKKQLIEDLIDTMRSNDLVGMAAPQIGESTAIFVSEIRETEYRSDDTQALQVYVNPSIVAVSRETSLNWEGCGSIPGIFGQVERSKEVTVEFFDENGMKQSRKCIGLLAVIVQHEIGHLNGQLFTDLADPRTFVSTEYYLRAVKGVK